jgi:glycosyltransferase involved in cell wall biosynthesis
METEKMKVFHGLVNYGTQSGFLARELRRKGVHAKSVTRYDPYERQTDVNLKHSGKNIFQKLYNYLWNQAYLVSCFFRFNVFHFYASKTLFNSGWDLPLYRLFGKKVVMEYLGIDVQKYRYSVDSFKYTNIVHIVDEESAEEHDREIDERLKRHDKYVDLQLVCAPCYSPFVEESSVLPLGLDIDEYQFTPYDQHTGPIRIMHAPTHRGNKGTPHIIGAIDRLIEEGYPVEKMLVENVSHDRLKEMYKECDIFVDQIMGGWYGTATIEAMATGRPVVCSIYEEFCEYVDYTDDMPIIHADPDTIYDVLKNLVLNERSELELIGRESRAFAENVHDISKTTDQLLQLYKDL